MIKRVIPVVPPAPPECPACTTPTKCGTVAWKERKGPRCVGRANGPDRCDCLNDCGDDPWLLNGLSLQCAGRTDLERKLAADEIWSALAGFGRVFAPPQPENRP